MSDPSEPSRATPAPDDASQLKSGLSRRAFLKGASTVTAAGLVAQQATAAPNLTAARPGPDEIARLSGDIELELTINGVKQRVQAEPRTTLLGALRHRCSPPLTGTKEVCDHGNCGACTVLVDDKPVYSCLMLAADAEGRKIRTVEGLAPAGELSPVQDAFWKCDAQMCGFCTPGFVMASTAALERNPDASDKQVREQLSGNLCRCGTYPHIFQAVQSAKQTLPAKREGGR